MDWNMNFAALDDYQLWCSLSIEEQDTVILRLERLLWKDFAHLTTSDHSVGRRIRIPTFVHRSTQLEFNLIPGGVFDMGLSQVEEENARVIDKTARIEVAEMRPIHRVRVSPFLMTKFPVMDSFARNHILIDNKLLRPEFGEDDDLIPIYLSRSEIQALTEQTGFSLPSEAQWEYACRGTTKTLFYFGDTLPDEETLESAILLSNFTDVRRNLSSSNPFGLVGLSVGERCADTFQNNYYNARNDDLPVSLGPPYVVRSGAGILWPWQDCDEWTLCMSAMRRSSDCLEDGTCGARLVHRLNLKEF
jgi:hypothetical protein